VVVGVGAPSGTELPIPVLAALRARGGESHLVMTVPAHEVAALADHTYTLSNQAAQIASGSFRTVGMIVAPCDPDTLDAISLGLSRNLLERAADVTIKEGRPLVLVVTDPNPDVVRRFDGTTTEIVRMEGEPGVVVERALNALFDRK
jgi:polyprenyl P-hydroxybenzoate/phenylacrylic acid decarboxylase-like protein